VVAGYTKRKIGYLSLLLGQTDRPTDHIFSLRACDRDSIGPRENWDIRDFRNAKTRRFRRVRIFLTVLTDKKHIKGTIKGKSARSSSTMNFPASRFFLGEDVLTVSAL